MSAEPKYETPDEKKAHVTVRKKLKIWVYGAVVLILVASAFAYIAVHEADARAQDRLVARYVLCKELETMKSAQRIDLTEKINDAELFLSANPTGLPLPGLGPVEIRRAINRNKRLRRQLAPYPRGCAAFARNPAHLDVKVPTLPKE